MKYAVKVQAQNDKKRDKIRLFIYIPLKEQKRLQIQKGNLLEIEFNNPHPGYIEAPTREWKNGRA